MEKKNSQWGTTLDSFLAEESLRVIASKLRQEMARQGMPKAELAERLHTSRTELERILKAKADVTIESSQCAAALVGRELRLELV